MYIIATEKLNEQYNVVFDRAYIEDECETLARMKKYLILNSVLAGQKAIKNMETDLKFLCFRMPEAESYHWGVFVPGGSETKDDLIMQTINSADIENIFV